MKLGRLSVALLALICLAGIAGQWAPEDTIAWWRYGAAGLLAGLLYEWMVTRNNALTAHLETPVQLKLGRASPLYLDIANGDARAHSLVFVPGLPADIAAVEHERPCELAAGKSADIEFIVTGCDIGTYRWPNLPARLKGPLGLAWWPLKLTLDAELNVVPDLLGSQHTIKGNLQLGDRSSRPGSGLELHHLREYAPGDPLHSINWKATARSQQLITQVFSEEQHLEIMLVLDVGRSSRTRVDGMSQFSHYVNLASTLSQLALASGDYVGLVAAADRPVLTLPPQRGVRAMSQINGALRKLQPAPVEVNILDAALEVQRLTRNRSLVIYITDLYSQAPSGDFGRSLKMWGSRHLPFVVSLIGADVTALGERRATTEAEAYTSLAAAEYRNSLDASAEAVRRMGARAIVARPAELQSRVIEEYRLLKAQRRV